MKMLKPRSPRDGACVCGRLLTCYESKLKDPEKNWSDIVSCNPESTLAECRFQILLSLI